MLDGSLSGDRGIYLRMGLGARAAILPQINIWCYANILLFCLHDKQLGPSPRLPLLTVHSADSHA